MIPEKFKNKLDEVESRDQLTDEEFMWFRSRNITKAVGSGQGFPNVNSYEETLVTGDRVILTSDGVHDNLTFSEIEEIAAGEGDIAEILVKMAKERLQSDHFRAKPDDISVVVVEVE